MSTHARDSTNSTEPIFNGSMHDISRKLFFSRGICISHQSVAEPSELCFFLSLFLWQHCVTLNTNGFHFGCEWVWVVARFESLLFLFLCMPFIIIFRWLSASRVWDGEMRLEEKIGEPGESEKCFKFFHRFSLFPCLFHYRVSGFVFFIDFLPAKNFQHVIMWKLFSVSLMSAWVWYLIIKMKNFSSTYCQNVSFNSL